MTTISLAPVKITLRPIGQVSVKLNPTVQRTILTPSSPPPVKLTVKPYNVKVSLVGTQGPPGASGASSTYSAVAGETLGGDRVVRLGADGLAYYADHTLSDDARAPLYWTLSAAAPGQQLTMRSSGPVETPGYGWTPGARLWLGENGLTEYAPDISTPFRRAVAVAETADRIYFNPSTAIYN